MIKVLKNIALALINKKRKKESQLRPSHTILGHVAYKWYNYPYAHKRGLADVTVQWSQLFETYINNPNRIQMLQVKPWKKTRNFKL